jgi:hypothetical protein
VNSSTATHSRPAPRKWLDALLLAVIIVACLARMPHLLADFPTASIYTADWSWFTDEGWYSSSAMNFIQTGHWVQPGDWSPGVAMPVWPAMATAVFHFTGISALALRRLGAVCSWITILLAYFLVRRYASRTMALGAAALIATSAILFFFSRMALLENPLTMMALAAMLAASYAGRRNFGAAFLMGVLLALLVLTKTTAVVIVPAILWIAFAQCGYKLRASIPVFAVAFIPAAAIYLTNQHILVRPHMAEYRDLWAHYGTAPIPRSLFLHSFLRLFYRGTWAGPVLFPLALLAVITAPFSMRRLLANPLFAACILWCAGVGFFLVYRFYGPPRYFSLMTVPVVIICVLWTAAVYRHRRNFGLAIIALLIASTCWNVFYIARWESRPEYQYPQAAAQIADIVRADPSHPQFILGHSAAQMRLFSGVNGVDTAFGPATVEQRITIYHPGWFILWNDAEAPQALAEVEQYDRAIPRATFHLLHDPVRNQLTLYELYPLTTPVCNASLPAGTFCAKPSGSS